MSDVALHELVALDELRETRRKKRIEEIHWIDALYQVYISAIVGGIAVIALSGLVGDNELTKAQLHRLVTDGPALLGLGVALAVAIGLRSGSRGGPLALEAADVRHVLLAPIDRGRVLRSPALRQVRFVTFVGTVVGAIGGELAYRRVGDNPVGWVVAGAAFGAATALLAAGGAFVAAGLRLRSWLATLLGGALVVWSVADVTDRGPTAPMSFLGRLAVWPAHVDLLALVPVAVGVVALVVGISRIGALSLESAERRSVLVGQLRFAVTLQDLRTVMVLRRQLAMELPRQRPWIRLRRTGKARFPAFRRGWRGVLRWPVARIGRVVVLGAVAGVAMRGVWSGTTPLIILAGLAMFVAGLDAAEPLAQEVDHPGRSESYPLEEGQLQVRHLLVPAIVSVLVAAVGCAAAVAVEPSGEAARLGAALILPAGLAAAAGAVVSVVKGAPKPFDDSPVFLPPEVAGMRIAFRAAWPPIIAIIGLLPLLAARHAFEHGDDALSVELRVASGVFLLVGLVAGWVLVRQDIKNWWSTQMAMAQEQQNARTKKEPEDG